MARLLCDDKNLLVGPHANVIQQAFTSRTMPGESGIRVYSTFLTPLHAALVIVVIFLTSGTWVCLGVNIC